MIGVCAASLLVCLALAWWQWERYSSASGSWQNLGYVLQWPLFGLFPAFVFLRMRKLRRQAALAEDEVEQPREPRPTAAQRVVSGTADETDDDTDDELAEYNRYLAELNARDGEKQ